MAKAPETAIFKVFQITELLEKILVELPEDHHLLLSQRTCNAFRNTIRGSACLQRGLFFRPGDYDARDPHFNPKIKVIASAHIVHRIDIPSEHMARIEIYKVGNLTAVFKHKGELWAVNTLRKLRFLSRRYIDKQRGPRFPRRTLRRPKIADFDQAVAWNLIRVASNELLSCPTFDLADSSLREMLLVHPGVSVTITLFTGNPDATVTSQDSRQERCNDGGDAHSPKWTVRGHAYASLDTIGKTIGQIFAEVDKIDGKYEVYKGAKGVAVRDFVGCGCEECHGRRTSEERIEMRAERQRLNMEKSDAMGKTRISV